MEGLDSKQLSEVLQWLSEMGLASRRGGFQGYIRPIGDEAQAALEKGQQALEEAKRTNNTDGILAANQVVGQFES